ncbi:hypothetical protein CG394_06510 [Gardnerella vaginalis]|uniref:Uncharacterized protein n=2 Tax=Gardnerella vaginalis TaxID=2702 RepID=E3DAL5_GARV3|nr:hypothetical protein HMPREF0421_21027 [Gardnerella vaginalis ATCC 14019]RFT22478.1 hypothetical protein CG394_06510 [Gardnerella vaginalis]TCH81128.1 hypothetical protein E0E48_02740 [Gardnerella vaginalis]TCH82371.1 hypothetical protein E0E46_03560 [Gardnerella vaginalis ATCC 14018 = JCM 11026]
MGLACAGLRWFVVMCCAISISVKILTQHAFCDSSQSPANLQRLATLVLDTLRLAL